MVHSSPLACVRVYVCVCVCVRIATAAAAGDRRSITGPNMGGEYARVRKKNAVLREWFVFRYYMEIFSDSL